MTSTKQRLIPLERILVFASQTGVSAFCKSAKYNSQLVLNM